MISQNVQNTVTGSQTGATHTVLSPTVNLPLHLRDGIWQADIHNLRTAAICHLCAGRGGKRAGRSRSSVSSPAVKISSPEKITIWSVCRSPVFHCVPLWWLPASFLIIQVQLFRTRQGGQAWTEMAAAGAVALHVSGSFPDLNAATVWAIRG